MKYTLQTGEIIESKPMGKCKFSIGEKSPDGMLTICDRGPDIQRPSKSYPALICQCECGNYTLVATNAFKSGSTKSCGCYNRKQAAKRCALIGKQIRTKDYTLTDNPFYTFIERTEEKTSYGFKWKIKCNKCNNIYYEVPNQLVSESRPKGNNPCSCWKHQSQGCNQIEFLLQKHNILYTKEYKFNDCCSPSGNLMKFDFYVGNNYLIEYDGEQHFKETSFFGNEKADTKAALIKYQLYDNIKNQYCITNNIPLIRIPYTHLKSISIEDLLLDTSKFIYKGENNE